MKILLLLVAVAASSFAAKPPPAPGPSPAGAVTIRIAEEGFYFDGTRTTSKQLAAALEARTNGDKSRPIIILAGETTSSLDIQTVLEACKAGRFANVTVTRSESPSPAPTP